MKKIMSNLVEKTIIYTDILIHRKRIFNFLFNLNLNINKIFDIGSNNGEYSLLFSKIYPKAKIYAFEPNPKLIKISEKKLSKLKHVKIIKSAVGNFNKVINFNIDNNSSLTSSLAKKNKKSSTYKVKKFLYGENNIKRKKTKLIKLDSYIENKNSPDLLKIDVEGYEEEVLKGAQNNLKKIKLIMIEFHFDKFYKGYSTNRLHKFLIKNNFQHIKSIKFPILNWEDRFYLNKN